MSAFQPGPRSREKARSLLMHSGYVGGLAFESSGVINKAGIGVHQDSGLHRTTASSLSKLSRQFPGYESRSNARKARVRRSSISNPRPHSAMAFISPELPPAEARAARAQERELKRQHVIATRDKRAEAKFWNACLMQRSRQNAEPAVVEAQQARVLEEEARLEQKVNDLKEDAQLEPGRRKQIELELTAPPQGPARERMRRLQVWADYLDAKIPDSDASVGTPPKLLPPKTTKLPKNKKFANMRTHDQELWPVHLSRPAHAPKLDTAVSGLIGEFTTSIAGPGSGTAATHTPFGTNTMTPQILR